MRFCKLCSLVTLYHPNNDDDRNKKVLCKLKDETNGVLFEEIVALKYKMYSLKLYEETVVIKKAKGVKGLNLKKKLHFQHYKECLFENRVFTATFNKIRSFNHNLYIITEVKKALSFTDDIRYIIPDNIHTLPFGNFSINDHYIESP